MGQGATLLAYIPQDLQSLRRIEIGEWCLPDKDFPICHAGNETKNGTVQHLNVLYRASCMYVHPERRA